MTMTKIIDAPSGFSCDVGLQLMNEPVVAKCGHTFERSTILQAIEKFGRCPLDQSPLNAHELAPNYKLIEARDEYLKSTVQVIVYTPDCYVAEISLTPFQSIERIKSLAYQAGILPLETTSFSYRFSFKGHPIDPAAKIESLFHDEVTRPALHIIRVFK